MKHPKRNFLQIIPCLTLSLLCCGIGIVAHAQDTQSTTTATPPPPPADSQQQIQQQAPASNVRAVRLSDVEGKVQVLNASGVAFDQAQLNMPVVEGMRFVTAEDGRVEIQFEDGSVARITPNSSLTVTQLSRNSDGSTATTLDVNTGLTYYELNGRAGQYIVHVGQASITPIDSSIFRVDVDNTPAELAVTHGSVHVTDTQNLALDVNTNQSIRFGLQDPSGYQLVQSVTANTWDQWNSDRDQALAEIESEATDARASTGNPDDPAWNDLDASGDWYNVPGYGMGWTPSGVGPNWDPYGSGYWGYYSGIGYTWISGYSWGWWPYHCGGWNWFDSFGWMWFPGNCGWGGGFYPYGAIWSIPPGYRRPVLPVHHPPYSHPNGGPRPVESLVAVNRGPLATQQFLATGTAKPAPRVFQYAGQSIQPLHNTFRPVQRGPLGESFTQTVQRVNPEIMPRRAYDAAPGAAHPTYTPNHTNAPPTYHPAPAYHPSTPAPSFHASPPPPAASHPHR